MDIRNAWLMGSSSAKYKEAVHFVHSFVDGQIDAAMTKAEPLLETTSDDINQSFKKGNGGGHSDDNDSDAVDDSLGPTVLLHELLKVSRDKLFIRNELLSIFMPARDGTAFGLGTIFFQLARNPQVWTKLRAEVLDAPRPFTFASLKAMPYLQAVIKEGTRRVLLNLLFA